MRQIKEGDYVGRISYNKDIDFVVDRILELRNGKKLAILKGNDIRIEADSYLDDLELIESRVIKEKNKIMEYDIEQKLKKYRVRYGGAVYTGRILHLDGDYRFVYTLQTAYKYWVIKIKNDALYSVNCLNESAKCFWIGFIIGLVLDTNISLFYIPLF